jgi:hypothetical protein
MSSAARGGAAVFLLVLAAACGGTPAAPAAPAAPTAVAESPSPAPPSNFPPLTGPFRTFVFARDLSFRVADYTRTSQFVLYDNGAFELQYIGLGSYRGQYTLSDDTVVFEWEGWSTAGRWEATGTLRGGELAVRYNLVMQLTDFDDAVYVLKP